VRNGEHVAIGPGKIALLEAVAVSGSITGAAKSLSMSYRRAWLLIDEMNQYLRAPVVTTETGGPKGGGARLTPAGASLVEQYRSIERHAEAAVAEELAQLLRQVR
jgi:molybdate transport system regulatory protein